MLKFYVRTGILFLIVCKISGLPYPDEKIKDTDSRFDNEPAGFEVKTFLKRLKRTPHDSDDEGTIEDRFGSFGSPHDGFMGKLFFFRLHGGHFKMHAMRHFPNSEQYLHSGYDYSRPRTWRLFHRGCNHHHQIFRGHDNHHDYYHGHPSHGWHNDHHHYDPYHHNGYPQRPTDQKPWNEENTKFPTELSTHNLPDNNLKPMPNLNVDNPQIPTKDIGGVVNEKTSTPYPQIDIRVGV